MITTCNRVRHAKVTLLLGAKGEKRAEHFTIYAVFETPEEFRIVFGEKILGTIVPDLHEFVVGHAPLGVPGQGFCKK